MRWLDTEGEGEQREGRGGEERGEIERKRERCLPLTCVLVGGYYPTTCGTDVHFELEMFNGSFNTAHYLLHAAWDNTTGYISYEQQKQVV